MVKQTDVQGAERILNLPGELPVGSGWLGNSAGMIVNDDHTRCAAIECGSRHVPGVDNCRIHCAAGNDFRADDMILDVQTDQHHDFLCISRQLHPGVILQFGGRAENLGSLNL